MSAMFGGLSDEPRRPPSPPSPPCSDRRGDEARASSPSSVGPDNVHCHLLLSGSFTDCTFSSAFARSTVRQPISASLASALIRPVNSGPARRKSRKNSLASASRLRSPSRSEEHTSELQSHSDLHSFPTRRSSDLGLFGLRFDPARELRTGPKEVS